MKIGTINSIWRFPLKSFGGEKIDNTEINFDGIIGDRNYALFDNESGKIVSAKNTFHFPNILMCNAKYLTPPKEGQTSQIEITLNDNTVIKTDLKNINHLLSDHFKRNVTLKNITIDNNHHINSKKSFMDAFPISIITTSSLNKMAELSPNTNFDPRRFRMNLVINTNEKGFIENNWVGKSLKIGKNVILTITELDARCIMTNLAQKDIQNDNNVLLTLAKYNNIEVFEGEKMPCAGVYASIKEKGKININDDVEFL